MSAHRHSRLHPHPLGLTQPLAALLGGLTSQLLFPLKALGYRELTL